MNAAGRTPIACTHCAKAKAKCDKKIPCSRCAGKHILCQARTARRSSDMTSRRGSRDAGIGVAPGNFDMSFPPGTQLPLPPAVNISDPQIQWSPYQFQPSLPDSTLGDHNPNINGFSSVAPSLQTGAADFVNGPFYTQMYGNFSQSPQDLMHSMPETEAFMNGTGYNMADDHSYSMGDSTQMLQDLDMSSMTNFNSPLGGSQKSTFSHFENIPYSETTAAFQHVSLPEGSLPNSVPGIQIPSLYHSESTPTSVMSSSESPSVQDRPRSNLGVASPCAIEPEAVIAAQGFWYYFQCNSPLDPATCPKTAKIHLDGLEKMLKAPEVWMQYNAQASSRDYPTDRRINIKPLSEHTRARILSTTRTALERAFDIQFSGSSNHRLSRSSRLPPTGLLPSDALEYFLRAYACRLEPYYTFLPANTLDMNDILQCNNESVAGLLLLLMIGQGAMATPTSEARFLSSGLTELGRGCLLETIEKSLAVSSLPITLRCGLLFTTLAAWGGDKWHMDAAMGQRGMHIAMLGDTGMLDFRESLVPIRECQRNPQAAWEVWKESESRSRLVSSWVKVDQELSLFHDTTPMLSVNKLNVSMPDNERLWQAASAVEWSALYTEETSGEYHENPLSLSDLYRCFIQGEINYQGIEPSPIQLRLLLYPLQALVCHLRQHLSCFSDGTSSPPYSRRVGKSGTAARLEEVQSLLQQWYDLSKRYTQNPTDWSPVTCSNLILYHLINLNTITDFPEIEQFARGEPAQNKSQSPSSRYVGTGSAAYETFFHCGQVLRLLRATSEPIRPPWWAAAVYRVALISWSTSMAESNANAWLPPTTSSPKQPEIAFAIDILTPDHPAIMRYRGTGEGLPMFSRKDGTLVSLSVPSKVLAHCVEFLDEDLSMRFTDGIKRRLARLGERWEIK